MPCGFEQLDCRVSHVTSVDGFGFGIVEVKSDGLNVLSIPGFVDAAKFAFADDEAKGVNHVNQKICFILVHVFLRLDMTRQAAGHAVGGVTLLSGRLR